MTYTTSSEMRQGANTLWVRHPALSLSTYLGSEQFYLQSHNYLYFSKVFFLFYVYEYFLYTYAHRGQKMASYPLELELLKVVGYHVAPRN